MCDGAPSPRVERRRGACHDDAILVPLYAPRRARAVEVEQQAHGALGRGGVMVQRKRAIRLVPEHLLSR